MDSDFGDDVGVQAVAEIDRVDVVTRFQALESACLDRGSPIAKWDESKRERGCSRAA